MTRARVLIINDNASARLAQLTLERDGCETLIATSPEDALSKLESKHFDLLVLGQRMAEYGPDGSAFLAEWRSRTTTTDHVLTLMTTGRHGPHGIVRHPFPNQAHAYIRVPMLPDDLRAIVAKLLAGASTQSVPGDEGYVQYEHLALKIAFEYPAWWEPRDWKDSINVFGPFHRSEKCGVNLQIDKHFTSDPESQYLFQEVLNNRYRTYRELRPVMLERRVTVSSLTGREMGYLWKSTSTFDKHSGKLILTIVSYNRSMYALSLEAAQDGFGDYLPVYAHLLESLRYKD